MENFDKFQGKIISMGNKEIKLSFLSTTYTWSEETGEVSCRLTCKLNISDIEKKYLKFSDRLKKKIVDGLLETYNLYATASCVENTFVGEKNVKMLYDKQTHQYNYFDTFTVVASAKPQDGDTFDLKTGKMISENKAKRKAYKKSIRIMSRLATLFNDMARACINYAKDLSKYHIDEQKDYLKIAGLEELDIHKFQNL